MTDKIRYFLEAWEMNGIGNTVATVQDSPGTVVTITVDDLKAALESRVLAERKEWNPLTDEDRKAAFESLPDMLEGFLKKWGWLNFAKEIERRCKEKNPPIAHPTPDDASQNANSSSVAESNTCAAQDDASTEHKFAIIKDRHYDGEGLTLWVWDGRYYCGTDGDCLLAHPDGSLDGFNCEWLTHDQLEQRLNAAIDRAMQDKESRENQA
jgi:hypothetical protein